MDQIQVISGDREFTFRVEIEPDYDAGPPWEWSDCHGPVSEWTTRTKTPGEMVLVSYRGSRRYYDFAEAVRIALRDGWDRHPYNDGSETKRQQAARAAWADYEYLRGWCNDEWRYVGVFLTLLDDSGAETEVTAYLGGLDDSDPSQLEEAIRLLADELASGYGSQWREVDHQTYGYMTKGP